MRFTAFLMLPVLVGCESNSPSSEISTPGTPLAIEATPVLSIGTAEGDTLRELFRVVSPFITAEGHLAIPLANAKAIRIFDMNGSYLRTLGRVGEGPGEFRELNSAWARGDTIEALDSSLRRITRFFPGDSVESFAIQLEQFDVGGPAGPLMDGWAVSGVADWGWGERDMIAVHFISRSEESIEVARAEGMLRIRTDNFGGPTPLTPRAVIAIAKDRVLIGESLTPTLRAYGSDGSLQQEYTWTPPASVSPEDARTAVLNAVRAGDPNAHPLYKPEMIEAAPLPDRLPVFWHVIADAMGFVWIREYDPMLHSVALGAETGAGGAWKVYGPAGEYAATILVPPDLEPVQITVDAVVGIARDEMGVETVRVHHLRRR